MNMIEFARYRKELKDLDSMIRKAKKGVDKTAKENGEGSEQHVLAVLSFVEIATNVSKRSHEIQQIFNKAEGANKR